MRPLKRVQGPRLSKNFTVRFLVIARLKNPLMNTIDISGFVIGCKELLENGDRLRFIRIKYFLTKFYSLYLNNREKFSVHNCLIK